MNHATPDAIKELWSLASDSRGNLAFGALDVLLGGLLVEDHAEASGSAVPSAVLDGLERVAEKLPPGQLDVSRTRIRALMLDADARRQAWDWFLDYSGRDGREAGEMASSPSAVRLAGAVLLTGDAHIPDNPVIWSPCCGSGRMAATIGRALADMGHRPKLLMWDVNPGAVFMSTIAAFLADLDADVQQKNCLTWNPAEEQVSADLVIADPPMGMYWESFESDIKALHEAGYFPWGLPRKTDASWLFQQVVTQGLSDTGRGVTFSSMGPLSASDSNSIRHRALDSNQLHSVILLPEGTATTTYIERAALVWQGNKETRRANKTTVVNLKERFEEAPKGSRLPRALQQSAIDELSKALVDPRPTRISRTLAANEFLFNAIEVRYPLLSQDEKFAGSTHSVPAHLEVEEWLLARYGSDANVTAAVKQRDLVDLSGKWLFETSDTQQSRTGMRRLSCQISALRTRVLRNQSRSTANQYGTETNSPWVVVRAGHATLEETPPSIATVSDPMPQDEAPWHFAFQVSPELDPGFLQAFLESQYGSLSLRRDGYFGLPSPSAKGILTKLDDVFVPVPSLDAQGRTVAMLDRLRMVSIRLDSDREAIWSGDLSPGDLQARVDGYLGDEDVKARLRTWPNPIASAAWIVVTSDSVPESHEKALIRFWEAVSGFHATLLLSAIKGIPDLEKPILDDIRSGVERAGHLNLREASMGAFSLIAATCGNQIRSRIQSALPHSSEERRDDAASSRASELSQIQSAFGGLKIELVHRLVSRDLARVFERLRPLRLPGAHGGAETRSQMRERIQEMYDLIQEWDALTRGVWPEFTLVRGGPCERLEDHYLQEVELVVGNDYPFSRTKVDVQDAMRSGALCMYVPASLDFMEIRAPLFEFKEVPEEAKLACYYFNRLRGDDLDLKSFVYPGELRGRDVAPLIGQTVHWLVGDLADGPG